MKSKLRDQYSPAGFCTANAAARPRTVDFWFVKTEHFLIFPRSNWMVTGFLVRQIVVDSLRRLQSCNEIPS